MEWVKITETTELPDGLDLIVYNTANDGWFCVYVIAESNE